MVDDLNMGGTIIDLISNKKLTEKSNILFTLSTLDNSESFHNTLQKLGFKKERKDEEGLITYKLPEQNKTHEYIKVAFDDKYKIGVFITKLRKSDEIPNKLEEPLRFQRDIAQLWIKPLILSDMLEELKESYDGLKVTWFSGISDPSWLKGKKRPYVRRTIQYGGDDGLETLEEMRGEYGILPKILEITIPHVGGFRVDNRGIVTVRYGTIKPIYQTIMGAIEDIQPWLKSFNQSKITPVQTTLSQFSLCIRKVNPWKIDLGRPLFANELISFEHQVTHKNEIFSTMNRYLRPNEDNVVDSYHALYTDEKNYSSFGLDYSGNDNTFSIYPHQYKSLPSMFNLINALHDHLEPEIEAV